MSKKQEITDRAKSDADKAKRELMRLYYLIDEEGLKVEAAKLDRIIARLEQWQNS